MRLETWNITRFGSARTLTPLVPNASEFVVRPDGGAIFVAAFTGTWPATLYDLGTSDSLTTDLATNGGGSPSYSVTLDSTEADRIGRLPLASPLITDAEALALVAKAASRIDAGRATLDLGTYPFGGTAPVWTVKATGQFENVLRGPIAQPPSRCEIVRLNARSGQLLGIQLFPNERDCA